MFCLIVISCFVIFQSSVSEKQLMHPLYERYRKIKRILERHSAVRSYLLFICCVCISVIILLYVHLCYYSAVRKSLFCCTYIYVIIRLYVRICYHSAVRKSMFCCTYISVIILLCVRLCYYSWFIMMENMSNYAF